LRATSTGCRSSMRSSTSWFSRFCSSAICVGPAIASRTGTSATIFIDRT
jgi:hypothetical protein